MQDIIGTIFILSTLLGIIWFLYWQFSKIKPIIFEPNIQKDDIVYFKKRPVAVISVNTAQETALIELAPGLRISVKTATLNKEEGNYV